MFESTKSFVYLQGIIIEICSEVQRNQIIIGGLGEWKWKIRVANSNFKPSEKIIKRVKFTKKRRRSTCQNGCFLCLIFSSSQWESATCPSPASLASTILDTLGLIRYKCSWIQNLYFFCTLIKKKSNFSHWKTKIHLHYLPCLNCTFCTF